MLGVSANLEDVMKLSGSIPIIEDNCEAIGGLYKGEHLGTICTAGILSFDQGKMIATGEGGMILTNDIKIDKIAREYHDHGHENNTYLPRGRDTKTRPGFNYRMTEMQAAVGKVQLSKLNKMLLENKKRYNALNDILCKNYDLRHIHDNTQPNFDTFILFEESERKRKRNY